MKCKTDFMNEKVEENSRAYVLKKWRKYHFVEKKKIKKRNQERKRQRNKERKKQGRSEIRFVCKE